MYALHRSILYIEYVTTKPPKPKNWRCVGGGDGAHRKYFLNFVSKEDKELCKIWIL